MGKKKPKVRWTAVEENFFCSTSCSGDDEDSNVSSANGGHVPNGLNGINGDHNGHHNGNGEAAHAAANGGGGGDGSQNGSAGHGYNKFGSSSSGGRRFHGGRREAANTIRCHVALPR